MLPRCPPFLLCPYVGGVGTSWASSTRGDFPIPTQTFRRCQGPMVSSAHDRREPSTLCGHAGDRRHDRRGTGADGAPIRRARRRSGGLGTRARRPVPGPAGQPSWRPSACSAPSSRRPTAGSGWTSLTYARIVEELAAGWMSLTGVLNTHMIVATLIRLHGSRRTAQRLLPAMASRRAPRRPVAVRGRRRQRHPGDQLPSPAGRRRVRDQRHQDVGHQRGSDRRVVALAARTEEGVTCFIVEKEPGLRSGGIEVSRHIEKLGYRGSRDGGDDLPRPSGAG